MTEQEKLELGKKLVKGDCLRLSGGDHSAGMQAAEILLSIESNDWIRARAVEHEEMQKTLDTLNRELDKRRGLMLSINEELKKQARLYGTGQVGTIPVATTEVGRLATLLQTDEAELFGEPEVGSTGSGALDTAKERKASGKGRTKGKGAKRRSLPRSLRTKKSWIPITKP